MLNIESQGDNVVVVNITVWFVHHLEGCGGVQGFLVPAAGGLAGEAGRGDGQDHLNNSN